VEAKMRRSTTSFPVYPLIARVCRGSLPTSEKLRTMKSKRRIRRIVILALSLLYAGSVRAEDTFHLPIGDPARRDREAPVVLDALTDTSKGDPITPLELPARLAGVRLLFLGESHTSMDSHRVEKRVIEALHDSGRKVAIGLEMFPYTEQKSLDEWVGSSLDEKAFLERSRWYKHWGYNWGYYREIFLFARENRVPLFAINAPREVISAVRKKGFQGLSEEESVHVPSRVDTDSAEYLRLFKASFEEEEGFHSAMSEEEWQSLFAAQCAWDATMAWNSVRTLEKLPDEKTILVVLAGAGHVQYGLGIQRQAAQWSKVKMASLLPVPVEDGKGRPVKSARASYADFLWGVPAETDPFYPALGVSTRALAGEKRLEIIHVEKGSAAEKSGLRVGDRVLSLDGAEISDRETFNRLLAAKRWGDQARVSVRRSDQVVQATVLFRRTPPGGGGP